MKKILCTVFTAALFCCFTSGIFAEMESANYRIPTSVMSGGGGPMSSGSFETNSTVGQSSPLMDPANVPRSPNYDLYPGFWYTIEMAAIDWCEGNFDGDPDVDGSDLAAFAANFGRTDCGVPTTCDGDFDEDGDVDGSDLATFASDFGRTDCP